MKKLIRHIKIWNRWRKFNSNSWYYKLLVLFGVVVSPTFIAYSCCQIPFLPQKVVDEFVEVGLPNPVTKSELEKILHNEKIRRMEDEISTNMSEV